MCANKFASLFNSEMWEFDDKNTKTFNLSYLLAGLESFKFRKNNTRSLNYPSKFRKIQNNAIQSDDITVRLACRSKLRRFSACANPE